MLKKIISLYTAIALLVCVCGCSGVEANNSSQEVEIIYEYDEEYEDSETQNTTSPGSVTSSEGDNSMNEEQQSSNITPSSSQPSQQAADDSKNNFSLADSSVLSKIKLNGRTLLTNEGVVLEYTASSLEFKANCSGTVYLEYGTAAGSGKRYFNVYVDGTAVQTRRALGSDNTLILERSLPKGEHTFKVLTDTEVGEGPLITFKKIVVDGELISVKNDASVIEFLGDSLSSGKGALCQNGAANQNSSDYASATAAYPYLIAQSIGYDYRIVSRSGYGLKAGTNTPNFLDFYKAENYLRGNTKTFTAQSVSDVDVVVVNLGTNDVGTFKTFDTKNADDIAKYSQHYADLITSIGYSKDTKILFVAGVGGCTEQNKAFDGAIKILNAAGYKDVYSFTAGRYMSGGAMHPTAQEHKKAADEILSALKQNGIV